MIPRIPVHDDNEESDGKRPFYLRPRVLLLAGTIVVVVVGILNWPQEKPKHTGPQKAEDTFIGEVHAYEPPIKLVKPAHAQEETPPPQPASNQGSSAPPPPPPPPPTTTQADRPPVPTPLNPLRGFAPQGGQQVPPRPRMLVYALPPIVPPAAPPSPPPETALDFKASSIPGLKASAAIDDTYQLMPGLLPLVLDTAINSDVPGPILAHLFGPVYSPKGVVLMEAGTQIIGRYESMGKGSRLVASGMRAHTPRGIWVPLAGQPMSDELGRSGLPGTTDNHYLERFGFATLLTLTQQGLEVLQAEASKGGNTYLSLNGGGGVSTLASQILQSQINIPPTFTKNQGETMALFLDQPIDFSASYRVHPVKDPQ